MTTASETTFTLPRTYDELWAFFQSYMIRTPGLGDEALALRLRVSDLARNIIEQKYRRERPGFGLDNRMISHRIATELAALDPSLSWLPEWKPRVAVKGGAA